MKNESKTITEILNSGLAIEAAIYQGDYKVNNRELKKTYKLFKKAYNADRDTFLNNIVPVLLEKGNYSVKIQTCSFLFEIKTYEKEAEDLLKEIVADKEARIFSHQAKIVLHCSRGIKL